MCLPSGPLGRMGCRWPRITTDDAAPQKFWSRAGAIASSAGAKPGMICFAAIFSIEKSAAASRRLRFTPFELAAQNIEVGFSRRLDEFEPLGGARDADAVAGLHGDPLLAVEGEEDGLRVARKAHLDTGRVAHNQRPVGERVRADGR